MVQGVESSKNLGGNPGHQKEKMEGVGGILYLSIGLSFNVQQFREIFHFFEVDEWIFHELQ